MIVFFYLVYSFGMLEVFYIEYFKIVLGLYFYVGEMEYGVWMFLGYVFLVCF